MRAFGWPAYPHAVMGTNHENSSRLNVRIRPISDTRNRVLLRASVTKTRPGANPDRVFISIPRASGVSGVAKETAAQGHVKPV